MERRSEGKVSLSQLLRQAQEGIRATPKPYRYRVRKFLGGTWGTLLKVRIPRLRGPEGEVRYPSSFFLASVRG